MRVYLRLSSISSVLQLYARPLPHLRRPLKCTQLAFGARDFSKNIMCTERTFKKRKSHCVCAHCIVHYGNIICLGLYIYIYYNIERTSSSGYLYIYTYILSRNVYFSRNWIPPAPGSWNNNNDRFILFYRFCIAIINCYYYSQTCKKPGFWTGARGDDRSSSFVRNEQFAFSWIFSAISNYIQLIYILHQLISAIPTSDAVANSLWGLCVRA